MDGHVLGWERRGAGAVLEVADGAGRGARASTTTFVLDVQHDRLRVELALLPTSRTVDVSLQPDLFGQVLPVGPGPCADGSAGATVARWIVSLADGTRMWRPAEPTAVGLLAVVGGAVLPLLGAAYDAGAAPVREVPRWAAPLLGATTPCPAARAAFDVKGTKAVARAALVVGLVQPHPDAADGTAPGRDRPRPRGTVALHRVAVALMGAPVLEPDRLAGVLSAEGPAVAPERWPDGAHLATGRALASPPGPPADGCSSRR